MSDRDYHKVGNVRQLVFEAFDPVTGLAQPGITIGTFAKTILLGGAVPGSPPAITITDLGSGRYLATYTPGLAGYWYLSIRHATYNPQGWTDELAAVAIDAGELTTATITAVAVAVMSLPLSAVEVSIRGVRCLGNVVQRIRNKAARVNSTTWAVYESDNTTQAWNATVTLDPTQQPIISETPN